jgi:hypothetical protein
MPLGDLVYYKISAKDEQVLAKTFPHGASSSGVRGGTLPTQGQQLRATVVREHGGNVVNLNVQIDANIGHWVRNVAQGTGEGQWSATP